MKEIIGAVVLLVSLYSGTRVLKALHDTVRKEALEKAAKGLPPLPRFNPRKNQ